MGRWGAACPVEGALNGLGSLVRWMSCSQAPHPCPYCGQWRGMKNQASWAESRAQAKGAHHPPTPPCKLSSTSTLEGGSGLRGPHLPFHSCLGDHLGRASGWGFPVSCISQGFSLSVGIHEMQMYVNEGIPGFWGGRLPPAGMGVIPDYCGWGWGPEKESPPQDAPFPRTGLWAGQG